LRAAEGALRGFDDPALVAAAFRAEIGALLGFLARPATRGTGEADVFLRLVLLIGFVVECAVGPLFDGLASLMDLRSNVVELLLFTTKASGSVLLTPSASMAAGAARIFGEDCASSAGCNPDSACGGEATGVCGLRGDSMSMILSPCSFGLVLARVDAMLPVVLTSEGLVAPRVMLSAAREELSKATRALPSSTLRHAASCESISCLSVIER
jgi:hypothetical protein